MFHFFLSSETNEILGIHQILFLQEGPQKAETSGVQGSRKAALLKIHLCWPFCIPPAPVLI